METPRPPSAPRPEPPEPPAPGLWSTWPRFQVLALTFLLMAANAMVQYLVFGAGLGMFASVLAGAVLGVLLPLAYLGRNAPGRMLRDLGVDLPPPPILGAAAVLTLCSLLPTSRLAEISLRLHPPEPGWEGLMLEQMPRTTSEIVLAFLTVAVVAPLVEEIIFRSLLQGLAARLWGAVPGIVVGALVFALVHNEAWFLFGLIGVGLVFGFVFQATGSVTTAWAAHAVHNTVSFAMMLQAREVISDPAPFTVRDAGWLLVSVGGMLLAGGYLLVRGRLRRGAFKDPVP